MRKTTVVFIIICLALGFSYVAGTDDDTEKVRPSVDRIESQNKMTLLQETLKTLREEKQQYYQMRQEWKNEKKDMLNQMKSLALRIEYDAKELEAIKKKNTGLKEDIEVANRSIKELTDQIPLLKALFLKELQWLTESIRFSLPWQEAERMAQVKSAESKTQEPDIKPAESFRRIWDILSEESALTRLCEVGSIKIRSEGGSREKEVDAIRIGRLYMLYQSEDQKETGVLFKDSEGNLSNTRLASQFQAEVHTGILVLMKRKPPTLVTLPFPLAIYKEKYAATEESRTISNDKGNKQDDKK